LRREKEIVDFVDLATDAVQNPTQFYGRPSDVIADARLSRGEKLAILEAWELDARALAVASEESMSGGEPDLLSEVVKARLALGDETSSGDNAGAPTKHGARKVSTSE
jgi:hypothetical protein